MSEITFNMVPNNHKKKKKKKKKKKTGPYSW